MKNYQDTENKILGNLLLNPLESKSLHQIAMDTTLSYVTVHKIVPRLHKRQLLTLIKKGKANLVAVNFEHADVGSLSSAMLYQKKMFLEKNLSMTLLLREIEEALSGNFYILLLFGSYATGEARKDSDIDFLFMVPDAVKKEPYLEKINQALELYPKIKKDFKVIFINDFREMLQQKYTVGRSAFQQSIVLFGVETYYSMVKNYVRTQGY